MIFSYRTRQLLKNIAVVLLMVLLVLALVLMCWFLWLERFVVYTRDQGAILDFNLSADFGPGEQAVPPEPEDPVSIYYNEGDNTLNTSTELTQMVGYYVDAATLEEDLDAVRNQLRSLPSGTPVLVDVKSIYGNFFYSSNVSDKRNSALDTAAMDELIKLMETNGLYAIARIPALRDYYYGLNHVPDGLPLPGGYLWMDEDYCYWLNPAREGTMTYLVQIITELRGLGFDEVVLCDFYFPDEDKIVFNGDKDQAIATAAQTLVTACATEKFAVSFVGQDPAFPLPEGRSRLYLEGVAAASAAGVAQQTGLADPAVNLVFLTEVHDTRFDIYSVLRPLSAAH